MARKIKPKHLLKQMLHDELAPFADSAEPACVHFGECGGCEFQNLSYEKQVAAKASVFRKMSVLNEIEDILPWDKLEIVSSPTDYRYRQRMDFVFAFNKAGLRKRNSHKWVVELEMCHLTGEKAFNAFKKAHELTVKNELDSYNYLSHHGFMRYFVVRQTRNGQVLLSLVTKSTENAGIIDSMAQELLDGGYADSIYWLLSDGMSDISFGAPVKYYGESHIFEEYLGKKFLIGPNTFFQANPNVAEQAYKKIANYAPEGKLAIDAYSGTGVIAQLMADKFEKVVAVENIDDNVDLAHINMENNGIPTDKIEYLREDAVKFLRKTELQADYLVVNPPRTGLEPKACEGLCRLKPPLVAYMSCNPITLINDLKILKDHYKVEELTLFDMFPQTRHWESLLLLRPIG